MLRALLLLAVLAPLGSACTGRNAAPDAPPAPGAGSVPAPGPVSGACADATPAAPDDATACGSLFPVAVPQAVRFSERVLASRSCQAGLTDGAGRFVALPTHEDGNPDDESYVFVPMAGGAAGPNVVAFRGHLVAEPSGYDLVPGGSIFTPPFVRARPFTRYDEQGAVVSVGGTLGSVVTLFPVPGGGGSVAVTVANPVSGGPFAWRLERVDASGAAVASYEIGSSWDVDVVATTTTGHTLVADDGRFRWLDAALAPMTDWFTLAAPSRGAIALADGSLAFPPGDVLRDGATSLSCAPRWLRERPGARVTILRGGAAYAVLPSWSWDASGGQARCSGALEVFAANGTRCGEIALPAVPCDAAVGEEGTVFAVDAEPVAAPAPAGALRTCTWEWWPALLR